MPVQSISPNGYTLKIGQKHGKHRALPWQRLAGHKKAVAYRADEESAQLLKHRSGSSSRRRSGGRGEQAQALVILALAFFALIAFVGLLTDVGSVYVTYSRLKNALDGAAVAVANNIKETFDITTLTASATEVLAFHNINDVSSIKIYKCRVKEGEPEIEGFPADFKNMCPDVLGEHGPKESPRKLAWVQATEKVPVYFLSIFGVKSISLTASSVGEAATVDLVLVFDTSESMASDDNCADGYCTPGYVANNFDPTACNNANNCYPLRQAKIAAQGLIDKLIQDYDQVAIVTFDYKAKTVLDLNPDLATAKAVIDSDVRVHDDAESARLLWLIDKDVSKYFYHPVNPIFPDDRDGDGLDADNNPAFICTDNNHDLWDDYWADHPDPRDGQIHLQPCDDDNILDAYDWSDPPDGDHTNDNLDQYNPALVPEKYEVTSFLSTCSGCGIREATKELKDNGRPEGVWIMVYLSDGITNLSDMPSTSTEADVPGSFIYGYCGKSPDDGSFWRDKCIDWNDSGSTSEGRYCIDIDETTCPKGTEYTSTSKPYSVEDYAYDMVDEAALLISLNLDGSLNPDEPLGENIIIYSVGLGGASAGEGLLRYMANVGDEGSRANDPCNPPSGPVPTMTNCGNYYYAPTGAYLTQVFENIANRVLTKISR
jgi:hypothetical protein